VLPYNKNLKNLAEELRKNMTLAEKCLWTRIRKKSLGYTFFRQKPVGEYIVDFYCDKGKLVVEVDGGQHFTKDEAANDRVRNEYMRSLELTVFRFSNSEVLGHTDKVVEKIYNFLNN
jgi:very-short-patch-repair endonuclease